MELGFADGPSRRVFAMIACMDVYRATGGSSCRGSSQPSSFIQAAAAASALSIGQIAIAGTS
jgi:hypothetical protein